METKHILIIAALIVIICLLAGAIFGVLTKNVEFKLPRPVEAVDFQLDI